MKTSNFVSALTTIPGVVRIARKVRTDSRGFFSRFWCAEEFKSMNCGFSLSQVNRTMTKNAGAARGLHLQMPPFAETKLVSCVRGRVYDVAVDLREGSPTFLKWHGEILSSEDQNALLIPEGCAHGFQALDPESELIYLHSAPFAPQAERGFLLDDPKFHIRWPLQLLDRSDRDLNHTMVASDWRGIRL